MKNDHGRDLTGTEMAKMLDEFANGATKEEIDEFVEQMVFRTHRTIQQKTFGIFLALIQKYAGLKDGQYDLRNEQTVLVSKKICEKIDKYEMMMPLI